MTYIGKTIILFALTVLVIDSVPADTDVHAIDLINSSRTASAVVCPCSLDEPLVGYYLYRETVEAESALNACVNQINDIASANGLKQKSTNMQSLATVR